MQRLAFGPVLTSARRHASHTRSAVAPGSLATYSPLGQSDHAAQLAMLRLSENVPEAHAVQPRSALDDGADETYSPATQSLQGEHVVAFVVSE